MVQAALAERPGGAVLGWAWCWGGGDAEWLRGLAAQEQSGGEGRLGS